MLGLTGRSCFLGADRERGGDTLRGMSTPNIGEPTTPPITELNLHHKNARTGDVQAIKGSMVANGVYKPIVVNKGTHTGRPNEVLAGNHSLKAMRELAQENPDDTRWQNVSVWLVDVDDDRATRILLADNRTADLGSYDNELLQELLESVDDDLDGTGYDYDDLDTLTELVEKETAREAATAQIRDNLTKQEPVANVNEGEPIEQQPSKEVNIDEWQFNRKCPSCGFEWEE